MTLKSFLGFEEKKIYVLLDWGGNIEDEQEMTPSEAKKKNIKMRMLRIPELAKAIIESFARKNTLAMRCR